MTTTTTIAEDGPAKLGIKLPAPPEPFGTYVEAVRSGDRVSEAGSFAERAWEGLLTCESTQSQD